jgi:DNA-binding CsgD family transcriptional regulator
VSTLAPTDVRSAEGAIRDGDLVTAARIADAVLEEEAPAVEQARAARVLALVTAHRGLLTRAAELHAWATATDPGSASAAEAVAAVGAGRAPDDDVADGETRPTAPTSRAGADQLAADGLRASVLGSSAVALTELTRAAAVLECTGAVAVPDDTPAALAALVALHRGEPEMGRAVLDRAVDADVGGVLFRRRHRLLRAWTRMTEGAEADARAELVEAMALPGPVGARDELVAVGLEAGLARRAGDTSRLLALWSRGRAAVLRHPVDLYALLPLGELLVVAARLGETAWLEPHVTAAEALLAGLGRPALWAGPWHWAALWAAVAGEDRAAVGRHAERLAALRDADPRTAVLADAAALWVDVLDGHVDPATVVATAGALRDVSLAWDGARLAKAAAVRATDRKAISVLLSAARGLQALGPARPAESPADPGPEGEPGDATEVDEPAAPAPASTLSDREREVAELLLDGMTHRQIGDRLFITPKTVEHHVSRMRSRLGSTDRTALFSDLRAALGRAD